MTEQDAKDQEYFKKYGIKHHRGIKPNTCPFCGGNDVYENDSSGGASDYCYFPMHCSDCDKGYQAYYTFSYAITNE